MANNLATKRLLALLASTAAITFMAPATALAQSQEAEVREGEIIVTAQRREQNLQTVAAAATALSGDSLQDKGVERMDDLQRVAPALSISDAGLTQSVNIRGIGLASGSPAVANGVATYLDGVFQPPIVNTNSFYDIGSVEVFRGPQGTFVGSNSTGGAIFINSRNPELGRTSGYAEGSVGNYNSFGFEGALNVPLTTTMAMRGAVKYRKRDSFYTDIGPNNNKPASLEEISGRIGVMLEVDAFRALLKVEGGDKKSGGFAYQALPGTNYAPYRPDDIRTLDYDSPTQNDETAFQASLELRYEFDGVTLRSISGFQNKRSQNLYDLDGTNSARYSPADLIALPKASQQQYVRERVWTQEVNLISSTEGPFDWIVGGYFQRNEIDVDIEVLSGGFPTDIFIPTTKTTTGVFAQGTYNLSEKLAVDIGGRYSSYSATGGGAVTIGRGIPDFPPDGLVVADLDGSHSDGRMTGKISLNWTPDENNLIYGFVTRGYKPGGFNSAVSEFDPETVIDYEIGWKATLAEGRVRTQLGAFYYDYRNFQFDVLDGSTGQVNLMNLPKATVKGIEGQIQARFGQLTIDGGFAYVDSQLGSFDFIDQRAVARAYPGVTLVPQCLPGGPSGPPDCIDYTPFVRTTAGGPNLFSPEWTYNVGASYRIDAGNVSITPRINYAYMGSQYSYIGYSPISDILEARGLVSAQIAIRTGKVELELYGTNLANKQYVSGQAGNTEYFGAPREYGLRLRFDF